MSFQHPCNKMYYRDFPFSLVGPTLKWFNQLLEVCITSFKELKNRFIRAYVGRVRQDKDEHSLVTIKQGENESISSFQYWFKKEFNLILGADQKIAVITFVEGLKKGKFKEMLLNWKPLNMEEVNELAYKYIQIKVVDKMAKKGRGKRPMEETH
ncbi:hypothetical protein LIER_42741 [Lithospermum erythrorhizon]|uniref:Retrotransposon gag domain-containing protein n=1 Tax=Lithospermum erythrorhizon TaxID=34254 RepID=A0AAV3NU12_LITER